MNQRNAISRFGFNVAFLCATTFVFNSLACAQSAPAGNKRNVLFLMADDLCASLGCYGAPVQSPNLDKLAKAGMKFDRAYCQYPLCGPTRCSLMSGLRPDTTGVLTNGLPVRHKLKDVVTLPQLFRKNGYTAMRVGKIYHLGIPNEVGQPGPDDPQSWDYTFNPKGHEYPALDDGDQGDHNPKDGQSFRFNILKGDGHEQHDYQAADEAIRLLREYKDKPFFLAVGFIRPHVPEIAPKAYFDEYPLDQIKLPNVPANDRDDIPAPAIANIQRYAGMTDRQAMESIRAYRASTSFMDAQLGRVVDELRKLGLEKNTVITFAGDHGYLLGQHGAWQKTMVFEPVCRVPMIICAPGVEPGVSKSLVESLDLYPTVAGLCGLTGPKELEGKSMEPILKDPTATIKAAAYTQVQRRNVEGRSVRTDRFRYTEWMGANGGAELYDEQNDPEEITNLAKDPKFADTVADMKKLLTK